MFFIVEKQQYIKKNVNHRNKKKYWTYKIKLVILNFWHKNGTFSMINQMQIMMQEMKLSIIQKY